MSRSGTEAHHEWGDLPPLVEAAVNLARTNGFSNCCRPEQGELLRVLARGVGGGVIGETGTGYGAGLAWLVSEADPQARFFSIERDPDRAAAVADLFQDWPAVQIITGDWTALREHGPFDLLVLDGGGQGKRDEPPLEPAEWLRPGGLLVIDDFTPAVGWPPMYEGRVDEARQHWLTHPELRAAEVKVAPDAVTILAVYPGPALA